VRFFAPKLKLVWVLVLVVLVTSCDTWDLPINEKLEFYRSVVAVGSWEELKTLAEDPNAPAILGLSKDIVLNNTHSPITVTRTLTIISFEGTHTISRGQGDAAFKDQMFQVQGNGNLTLGGYAGKTLILDGGAVWNTNSPPVNGGVEAEDALVNVSSAQLTIRDGAILRNNDNDGGVGGGVHMDVAIGDSAELTMEGGAISGNTAYQGGGVYVTSSGGITTLTMTGGTISGNEADIGGGVYVTGGSNSAILNMRGGAISGNKASEGGGVRVTSASSGSAEFTMAGGLISENEAAGGGGVWVHGNDDGETAKMAMKGGVISGNNAASGGGIYVYGGVSNGAELTMSGGAIIRGNEATSEGGGVYVIGDNSGSSAKLDMTSGTISGNKAISNGGGGVYIYGYNNGTAELTMSGGDISENKAIGSSDNPAIGDGGGVYVFGDGAKLTMLSGSISENTAASDGGGVYIWSDSGSAEFTMSGGVISGNTASGSASFGGGVYVNQTAVFKKEPKDLATTTSGVIYGKDEGVNNNTAKDASGNLLSGNGHAVYVVTDSKYRDTTVPESMELRSSDSVGWGQ
jgi:hypothetical protein